MVDAEARRDLTAPDLTVPETTGPALETELVLGPLLRYADSHRATIWLETGAPCRVTVTAGELPGVSQLTFTVAGHHYALVVLEGLPAGTNVPYRVELDGVQVWPLPGPLPPSVIPTLPDDGPLTVLFGSCRFAAGGAVKPEDVIPPDGGPIRADRVAAAEHDYGFDALVALARRLAAGAPLPNLVLLVGDQIYADEVSLDLRGRIRARRGTSEPVEEVADYEEYTWLYQESWRDSEVRWLLSTVPTAMIFDDHDVHDDWNTSLAWLQSMGDRPWWPGRLDGALMTYWVYQHLGNLTPDELAQDVLYAALRAAPDGQDVLRDLVRTADTEVDGEKGYRWSFARDLGRTRLVVADSRCGRILLSGRAMLGEREFSWLADHLRGSYDHLLLATSLPWLLPPALHHLEAWNERLCGSGNRRVAAAAERFRQSRDLEHWAAFGASFDRLAALLAQVGRGEHGGPPPVSISVLSGDVHHSSVIEALLPGVLGTRVLQLTSSPLRNRLTARTRLQLTVAWNGVIGSLARGLARSLGRLPRPGVRWGRRWGPWFGNTIGTVELVGRTATVRIERAEADGSLTELIRERVG